MLDFSAIMRIKQSWSNFLGNHPKLSPFLSGVKEKGFEPDQEIAYVVQRFTMLTANS